LILKSISVQEAGENSYFVQEYSRFLVNFKRQPIQTWTFNTTFFVE